MSQRDNLGDKLKGLAKETAGKASGDTDLAREGEEQQMSAQKSEEAERAEEEAEVKREEAARHEDEQRRHQ